MSVPYDKWGKDIDNEYIYDKNGDRIGYIADTTNSVMEPRIAPTTKKEVLQEIDAWRNDDGTYGDDDTAMYIAYKDGTFVDLSELDGKAYKKSGICGVSFSGPDDEFVWGGEMHNGKLSLWKTWSEDGESGQANSHAYWEEVGLYKIRQRVTFNNPDGRGGWKTKYETIRRSTVKRK